MPRPGRANLILLAVSTTFTLLVFEVVARLYLAAPLPWRFPQIRYQSDPRLIFTLRPDQEAYTADKKATINARGLRGPLVPYERTSGTLRILILGDSIAFGYGVAESDSVGARLAARLAGRGLRAEVINTGVPSYNVEQEVGYLAAEGLRYRPDWVLLAVCWNDINEKSSVRVTPDGWLATAGDREAGPLVTLMETPAGYVLRNLFKRSRLLYAVTQVLRGVRDYFQPEEHAQFRDDVLAGRESPKVARGWERMETSLLDLARQGKEAGLRILVVTFPLLPALEKDSPGSSYPSRVLSLAQAAGLDTKDLTPAYRAAFQGHDSLFIPYDADHPNARGHDLAAAEIEAALVDLMGRGESPADHDMIRFR